MEFEAEFRGAVWKIDPGPDSKDPTDYVAGIHEMGHAFLTNSTSIGGTILFYHTLSQWAQVGRGRYHRIWSHLVVKSRFSHEVFATWFSLALIGESGTAAKLPKEYQKFYAAGDALVADLEQPLLKLMAFLTIFRFCFESAELTSSACCFKTFKISDTRGKEFPDERLSLLSNLVPKGFFQSEISELISSLGDDGLGKTIRKALNCRYFADLFSDESREEADAVEMTVSKWLYEALIGLMDKHGFRSNPWACHMGLFESQLPIVEALCEEDYEPVIRFNRENHSSAYTIFMLAENEILTLRSEALPAVLILYADLDPNLWDRFDPAGISHFLIDVQFVDVLRANYQFSDDDITKLEAMDEPVVFIHSVESSESIPQMYIIVLGSPDEMTVFCENCPIPVFGSLSTSALFHQDWIDLWGSAWDEVRTVIMMDSWLPNIVREGWNGYSSIRYSKLSFDSPCGQISIVAFLTDESDDGVPWIVIGSHLLARALVSYMESLEDERFVRDPKVIEIHREKISMAVSHLIHSQRFISRNKQKYN